MIGVSQFTEQKNCDTPILYFKKKLKDGKTQQVKALIQKYGADKLSGVQPEKYADLLRDAKAL